MDKVVFAWPPLRQPKGHACIGQNRQFQILKSPFFAYPIVPATCATMLQGAGHPCLWLDAVAEDWDEVTFGRSLVQFMPQFIVLEASTPVIERYKEIIDGIKKNMPEIKIILCGDHATKFPEQTKKETGADFIVSGGDWHFKVFNIISKKPWPVNVAPPHIERTITRWWLYAYKNGNFKYLPGTYIMSAFDCWHKQCTFCSWAQYHKRYHMRPVQDVLDEIGKLAEMGFKEIFDDAGTLPTGDWLVDLCKGIIERGYNEYVAFGANMRFGALTEEEFYYLGRAGYRMLLWGMESVNQTTLDRLKKSYKISHVRRDLKLAKKYGIESHLTAMFGFPWESYVEAKRTYDMTRFLLRKGWAASAQATICIPYPNTPLWQECKDNGWLLTENWDEYDMTKPVMRVPYDERELFKFQRGIYNTAFHPEFLARKLMTVRNLDDLKYILRIGRKVYDRFGNFFEVAKPPKE